MRKGTASAVVVDFQIPDNCRQQDDRRVDEKIALLLNPRLVQVEHDGIGRFVGVRYVGHGLGSYGVAAVRFTGIIEVDDAEHGPNLVGIQMPEQVVIGDTGQIVELEVVDIHREPFLDMLLDITVYNGIGLSRSGRSEYHRRTERIDDVDPAAPPPSVEIVSGRQVDRVLIGEVAALLLETLVLVVERIVGQMSVHQPAEPDTGSQQTQITGKEREHVAPSTNAAADRQETQEIVEKEEKQPDSSGNCNMCAGYVFVADAFRAVAAQRKECACAEFGRDGI